MPHRSGGGTGDGIASLVRAFFSAGTPSVVATLWDVADEPTNLLISAFYSSLKSTPDKAQALRDAQLKLLRALRAREVKVDTPAGRFALSENPAFWAGFLLVGEP